MNRRPTESGPSARPWFVHDFTHALGSRTPDAAEVTISCAHPGSITVAYMGNGLTGTIGEARANARRIVHAVNVYDDLVAALKLAKVYAEQAVPFVTPAKRDLALIVAALAKARAKT